jgi:hypothetical protein
MPTSLQKIESNRRNAQKSTGPRTPEGKAKVAQNAAKHGLYARKPVLNSPRVTEIPAHYDSLRTALSTKLDPKSPVEHFLIQRIADSAWQLQRIENIPESQFLDNLEGLSELEDGCILETAGLLYTCLVYKRRLVRRLERSYAVFNKVKQSHLPIIVQQLEQAIIEKQNRCETKPSAHAGSPIQRREAPWSRHMSGCESNPFLERVI